MRRGDFFVAALVVAAFVAFLCVLTGCAASRDPLMARVFEAPNVIHVCVRPPNVPKNQASWAVTASGDPLTAPSEVDIARRNGLAVYVFDPNAPPRSAKLLPIPHHRLECPAPPKPRVVMAKVEGEGEKKKEETKKVEPSKPKPRPMAKRIEWCPEAGHTRRRGDTGSRTCTRVVVRARTEPVVVVESPRDVEPSRRCQDPGQTRRRRGSGSRICTKVLVEDRMEPVVVAENRPLPVEPPVPKDPSEVEPGDVWQYETWRQTPEETTRLERAYECIKGFCHSRHKNFQPKAGKKPAGTHNGQSLSTGSDGGASAPKTTVKTRTRPFGKPKGAKPKGGAAGQAGNGSAADPPAQVKPKRGGETPAAARGREAHEEFKKKVEKKKGEGWRANKRIKGQDGKYVVPDAITPKGHPIELKPNTPTGKEAGKRQMKKYEAATGKKGRVIYYEP
ncbi:hypothetical protein [Polyangium spumosum]|uniref:Tox-REase-9 domain-containing protein n=1 Tax=Polyangium spumosum TaxID=889282 RepID=A0A6N7PPA0_9BACT|nr:hypothetical protein [Polyangium spumosum]MRG91985.1 hypothetical protein [Polyangium spumosum]